MCVGGGAASGPIGLVACVSGGDPTGRKRPWCGRGMQPAAVASDPGHLPGQLQLPGAPVGDSGQPVVVGQCGQLGGLVLDLCHQPSHAQHDQQKQHRAQCDGGDVDRLMAQALLGEPSVMAASISPARSRPEIRPRIRISRPAARMG